MRIGAPKDLNWLWLLLTIGVAAALLVLGASPVAFFVALGALLAIRGLALLFARANIDRPGHPPD